FAPRHVLSSFPTRRSSDLRTPLLQTMSQRVSKKNNYESISEPRFAVITISLTGAGFAGVRVEAIVRTVRLSREALLYKSGQNYCPFWPNDDIFGDLWIREPHHIKPNISFR